MKYLETGTSFHGGLARKPGRGLIRRGLVCVCVEKILGWVSFHIEARWGTWGDRSLRDG